MIESLVKDFKKIQSTIRILYDFSNESVTLSQYQVYLVLSSMFLGIMPKQIHTPDILTTFGSIMTVT
jgi:hypothetical protein